MLRDTAESAGRRQGHVSHTGVPQTPPACGPPAGITIGSVAAVHGYVTQLLATAYQDASSKCRSGSSRGRHALQNNNKKNKNKKKSKKQKKQKKKNKKKRAHAGPASVAATLSPESLAVYFLAFFVLP
jgi:hypothetical protein